MASHLIDGNLNSATNTSLELAQATQDVMHTVLGHDRHCPVDDISVTDFEFSRDLRKGYVTSAKSTMTFIVAERSLNPGGSVFGGVVSCLADVFTTSLLMTTDMLSYGKSRASTSTVLQVEYLNGASLGDKVRVEITLERIGRDILFSGADFHNDMSGTLLYKARHQKKIFSDKLVDWNMAVLEHRYSANKEKKIIRMLSATEKAHNYLKDSSETASSTNKL